ncbi:polysaccharide pyruvyl transferase family protein [Conservatibacter flavescens]|uniref:Polysaccharide pyruvyl transferase n=1 Tax=Conservatibacter flavescens TaxID=28161 RepID=A0A2M8S250_9PAST|nr:polysaccharide pyruvyl transferase family protein [Conservatibacter flavescens]PJG85223.1 polysaccharide pyruvyl transferase [Conservatibacter flavescens]
MNSVLTSLKHQLHKIVDLIPDKNDVLYFDYPLHLNVGDLLIYAGTEQFFRDYQIHVRLRRCFQAFDIDEVKKYVNPNTTILCHGGGNFGDLYPALQQMREALVQTFPHNRIIVLPQTAFFSNDGAMKKAAAIFAQHKHCYLFARDLPTFNLMQNFSQHVQLCPDMAHQLYGVLPVREEMQRSAVKNNKVLYFLRKDIEASHIEKNIQAQLHSDEIVKDWEDILTTKDIKIEKYYSKLAKLANKLHFTWLKNKINEQWYQYANAVITRCYTEFLRYDVVVTSRLHGHIFSCLLGIPNQVCDNSYGKNSGYYNQWTKEIDYSERYEN